MAQIARAHGKAQRASVQQALGVGVGICEDLDRSQRRCAHVGPSSPRCCQVRVLTQKPMQDEVRKTACLVVVSGDVRNHRSHLQQHTSNVRAPLLCRSIGAAMDECSEPGPLQGSGMQTWHSAGAA